jgi:hypothetical protein
MPTDDREHRVRRIHELREEILGLTFEELAAHPHPTDWPKLAKVHSVCQTAILPAAAEARYAGRTVREILASMDEAHAAELREAINDAAITRAKGKPRRAR